MAFTTEFVMGAGGTEVEEIPVSMSGGGNGNVYPLTTVDAGGGAWIIITGTMSPAAITQNARPHLQIGSRTHQEPHTSLTGVDGLGIGAIVSGTVQIAVLSRYISGTTTLTGTVHVVRL